MSRTTKSILVVDDDPVVLRAVRLRLERAGYDVTTRTEALGTTLEVLKLRPDVVVLDVNMPALRGDRLIEAMRDASYVPPLVLHSVIDEVELARLTKSTGAIGYISKRAGGRGFVEALELLLHSTKPGT